VYWCPLVGGEGVSSCGLVMVIGEYRIGIWCIGVPWLGERELVLVG